MKRLFKIICLVIICLPLVNLDTTNATNNDDDDYGISVVRIEEQEGED